MGFNPFWRVSLEEEEIYTHEESPEGWPCEDTGRRWCPQPRREASGGPAPWHLDLGRPAPGAGSLVTWGSPWTRGVWCKDTCSSHDSAPLESHPLPSTQAEAKRWDPATEEGGLRSSGSPALCTAHFTAPVRAFLQQGCLRAIGAQRATLELNLYLRCHSTGQRNAQKCPQKQK